MTLTRHRLDGRDERVLGLGGSAIVSLYTDTSVLKGYVVWLDGRSAMSFENWDEPKRSLDHEQHVYERLGKHPSILQYLGRVEVQPGVFSLQLEAALYGDLRSVIRANDAREISLAERVGWAIDMSLGLEHMHSRGVIHCDFSCRNVMLTDQKKIKIGDFGGSKLDDMGPYSVEEPWYELPLRGRSWEDRPYLKRELFALGCAIYEIMAWQKPHADLSYNEVEKRYEQEIFPDLSGVACGAIIQRCWREEYDSIGDVLLDLRCSI